MRLSVIGAIGTGCGPLALLAMRDAPPVVGALSRIQAWALAQNGRCPVSRPAPAAAVVNAAKLEAQTSSRCRIAEGGQPGSAARSRGGRGSRLGPIRPRAGWGSNSRRCGRAAPTGAQNRFSQSAGGGDRDRPQRERPRQSRDQRFPAELETYKHWKPWVFLRSGIRQQFWEPHDAARNPHRADGGVNFRPHHPHPPRCTGVLRLVVPRMAKHVVNCEPVDRLSATAAWKSPKRTNVNVRALM